MFIQYVILLVIFYHSKLNGNILLSASTREENDKIKTLNLFISYVQPRLKSIREKTKWRIVFSETKIKNHICL